MSSSPANPSFLLSASQLETYQTTSILHLRDFIPLDLRPLLKRAAKETIPGWAVAKGKWMHFHELDRSNSTAASSLTKEGLLLCRTENFVDFLEEDALREGVFGKEGLVRRVVDQVAGEEMRLFKDKINYKQPGASGFAPHQDSPAFSPTAGSMHLTVLLPIDPMTASNGCLEFVPGKWDAVLPQESDGTINRGWCDVQRWEKLECGEGDLVVFSGLVPHRSGDNDSKEWRAAYYLTYNVAREGDNRAEYWANKRKYFPPTDEREPGKDYSEGAKVYNLGNPIV